MKRFEGAGVARVEIERSANRIEITVHTAKVGVVVGKGNNVNACLGSVGDQFARRIKPIRAGGMGV
jgi:small subunit ribosomal protein S3